MKLHEKLFFGSGMWFGFWLSLGMMAAAMDMAFGIDTYWFASLTLLFASPAIFVLMATTAYNLISE